MGCDVAILGTIRFPKGTRAWKDLSTRPEPFHDAGPFGGDCPSEPVSTALAHWARWSARPRQREFLTLRETPKAVDVRGVFDEETFRASGRRIAALLRSAAEVGAKGDVHFVGLGADVRWVLRLDGRTATLARDAQDLEQSTEVQDLVAESVRRAGRPGVRVARVFIELGDDVAAVRRQALDWLRDASPSKLRRAIAAANAMTGAELPLERDRALAVLEHPSDAVDVEDASLLLGLPLTIASFVDPAWVEPLALATLASKAPDAVRVAAALALAQTQSDAALSALVDAASALPSARAPSAVPSAALRALAAMPHSAVGEKLSEMLPRVVATVPAAPSSPADSLRLARAVGFLDILATKRDRTALPYVAGLVRSGPPAIRHAASVAVLRMASEAEMEKAFGIGREAFARKEAPEGDLRLVARADAHARRLLDIMDLPRPARAKNTAPKKAARKTATTSTGPSRSKPASPKKGVRRSIARFLKGVGR